MRNQSQYNLLNFIKSAIEYYYFDNDFLVMTLVIYSMEKIEMINYTDFNPCYSHTRYTYIYSVSS